MRNRDLQLDMYRSLVMIHIVCVVHVLYWLGLGREPLNSILLFEMPVIFFISGAAVKISGGQERSFVQMFKNRFKRIVLPYYIYLIYSFFFIIVLAAFSKLSGHLLMDISKFKWLDIWDWLIMKEGHLIPCSSHLWFLIPFFLISISTPIQLKVLKRIPKIPYLLINLVLFVLIAEPEIFVLDRSYYSAAYYAACFLGYNLFYLSGLFFYHSIKFKYIFLLFLFAVGIFYFWTKGETVIMQNHKFPPDMVFVSYSLIVLVVLSLVFTYVKIPCNKVLSFWNKNGYELFLYQNYVYWFFIVLTNALSIKIEKTVFGFLTCGLVIFLLSMGLNVVKRNFEDVLSRKFNTSSLKL